MNERRNAKVRQGTGADSPWPRAPARARDRGVKRDAVIRAAARAFNARGYHNTAIDDIAAALNVTKPTIYYYVANKEQLLFECFVAGLERIRTALREAHQSDRTARERLADVIRNYAEAIASEYGWCMVRAEDQDLSPQMSRHIKALKSEIDQGIRRLIAQGAEDGSITTGQPKMAAFALAGALNWIAHWYRENRGLTPAEVGSAFFDLFERGLMPRTSEAEVSAARSSP